MAGRSVTFTAANGDRLFGNYTGTTDPAMPGDPGDVVSIVGHGWFTGGTGRFEGATGTFTTRGSVVFPGWTSPDPWPFRATLDGELTY
jgi:hypothetical protein